MPYYSSQWDNRWQMLYRAAVFGQNLASSNSKIAEAEEAIRLRKDELAQRTGPWGDSEREAMEDALYALNALKTAQRVSPAA